MRRGRTYDWLPLWRNKWLWGSTRLELDPAERSVWVDFMCIAGNDDGWIRANETTPYPPEQLAGMLQVPVEVLKSATEKCLKNGKLSRDGHGCLYVINWKGYQLPPRTKRRLSEGMTPEDEAAFDQELEKARRETAELDAELAAREGKPR